MVGLLALAVIAAGSYLLLYPAQVPQASGSGFADNVFASAPVVFAGRLVVLSAAVVLAIGAVYVVASIVSLWARGQWFTRFGPFEISREAIGDLVDQAERLEERAIKDTAELVTLRRRLDDNATTIRRLLSLLPDEVRASVGTDQERGDSVDSDT